MGLPEKHSKWEKVAKQWEFSISEARDHMALTSKVFYTCFLKYPVITEV